MTSCRVGRCDPAGRAGLPPGSPAGILRVFNGRSLEPHACTDGWITSLAKGRSGDHTERPVSAIAAVIVKP